MSAGLTLRNFYFRLYPDAIRQAEVINFLEELRHIKKPLLIVWGRLPPYCSLLIREFIELSEGHIVTAYLPAYTPELNPVEYIWSYWKQHELPAALGRFRIRNLPRGIYASSGLPRSGRD